MSFLKGRYVQLVRDQAAARTGESWIAVRQLGVDIDRTHAEIATLQKDAPVAPASADELFQEQLALIEDEAEGWPLEDVELIYRACCRRLNLAPAGSR